MAYQFRLVKGGNQWLVIRDGDGETRVELKSGLTRVGGPGSDCVLASWTRGELHIWDEPPKAVYAGGGAGPTLNGQLFDEVPLSAGDRIHWGNVELSFDQEPGQASTLLEELPLEDAPLEEIPLDQVSGPFRDVQRATARGAQARASIPASAPVARTAAPESGAGTSDVMLRRLWAGMLVELGLTGPRETKRWQEAVLRGEFEPDAAARDFLRDPKALPGDRRLLERSERLMRDLVMAPMMKGIQGAGRRARGAAKGGTAFILAQFIAILVYTVIVLVIMLLLRVKYGASYDGFFDSLLGRG